MICCCLSRIGQFKHKDKYKNKSASQSRVISGRVANDVLWRSDRKKHLIGSDDGGSRTKH